MFLRRLVKLNSISVRNILPSNSGEDQEKGLCCILVLSQSGILDFFLPSGYYLPENWGGQTYFALFRVRPDGALPPGPPKLTPMHMMVIDYFKKFTLPFLECQITHLGVITHR